MMHLFHGDPYENEASCRAHAFAVRCLGSATVQADNRAGRLVDLKDRANRKTSSINVQGPESKGAFEYGRIVEALGRLVTPDAIAHLKVAASDYDPMIRQSACKAFARMPLDKVDEEIARIIHERFNDPMAYVREAAKEAGTKLVV